MKHIRVIVAFCLCISLIGVVHPLIKFAHADSTTDIEQKKKEIADLQAKLDEIHGQKQTLAKTIDYLNTRILLAQKSIEITQAEISLLDDEVTGLSGKITILESDLVKLSNIYVNRVKKNYIESSIQPFYIFLSSNGLSDFLKHIKYLQVAQLHDRQLMNDMQQKKIDFNQQKQDKEDKQTELEKAKKKLTAQQTSLSQQQLEKQALLIATNNDEKKYQDLLAKAKAELEAIRRFVSNNGGASILTNQTKCDSWGCYYNQRDSQWGNQLIGESDQTMAEVGCLITSMAMVATHYGKTIKPGDIAANPSVFFSNTAYMVQGSWSAAGVSMNRSRLCSGCSSDQLKAKINDELNNNHPVVVGLYNGPAHFIVIKAKSGDNYIMNDPFLENGSDKPLTDKYSFSDITTVDSVRVN